MSVIDDVRQMKASGQNDQAIANSLRQQGIPEREISEAISQADIKAAVSSQDNSFQGSGNQQNEQLGDSGMYEPPAYLGEGQQASGAYEGMEPSMTSGEQKIGGYQDYGGATQDYGDASGGYGEVGGGYGGGGYPEYQQYQEGMSSDVITEIAEQVVGEKMAQMRDSLERTLDFRTVAEAKIEGLNERLRRIEKIIDTLQLSILEKVGEYLGDVKNLKKELLETQKSFKAVHHKKK
jgi:hypothetical protein